MFPHDPDAHHGAPPSRAERRARKRRRTRELAAAGCECTPNVEPIDRADWPAHMIGRALSGETITHDHDCPLGTTVAELNARGVMPSMLSFVTECDR